MNTKTLKTQLLHLKTIINKYFTAMTIDKKEVITISAWKIKVFAPMLAGGLTALLTVLMSLSSFKASVEEKLSNQKEITQKLEETKVDRKELDLILKSTERIENTQERIEKKLDDHIDKPSKN